MVIIDGFYSAGNPHISENDYHAQERLFSPVKELPPGAQ